MKASVPTSLSTRRRVLRALAATPLAATALAPAPRDARAAEDVTLVLGNLAGGTRALVEAAKVLDGTPYAWRWANFQGAAPLFEAQRAGSVDLAPAGDLPVLAAARQVTKRASLEQHFVTDADIDALQKVADRAQQDAILPRRIDVGTISETNLANA